MNSSNSYDEEPITPLTLPGALVDCHRQETILLSAEKLRVSSVPGVYIAARFPEGGRYKQYFDYGLELTLSQMPSSS
jgi:hypothetical protein